MCIRDRNKTSSTTRYNDDGDDNIIATMAQDHDDNIIATKTENKKNLSKSVSTAAHDRTTHLSILEMAFPIATGCDSNALSYTAILSSTYCYNITMDYEQFIVLVVRKQN